ncbi:hypothetical protein FACS189499_07700 [Clostridia bacterium]|nr:hypothetical protein FACS189499_07700 [Clostridia bacterium]
MKLVLRDKLKQRLKTANDFHEAKLNSNYELLQLDCLRIQVAVLNWRDYFGEERSYNRDDLLQLLDYCYTEFPHVIRNYGYTEWRRKLINLTNDEFVKLLVVFLRIIKY